MSNHSESAPTWITCEYLEKMLQNFLKNYSVHVHDFDIGPGSAVGDNYACQILRINCDCTIQNKKKLKSIVAKVIPKTDFAKELTKGFDLFKTEIRMFSETLPLLGEILRERTNTTSFFPIFYKMDVENQILFMEDLKADGYVLANKTASLDFNHVSLVIKSLAKLHASSYLLFNKNPDHRDKYLDYFHKRQNEGNFMAIITKGLTGCFRKQLDLWPISEQDKDIFRKIDLYELLLKSYERKESSFNALAHSDCWINNMMFKYKNGKPVENKLFDYQLSHYNSIGLDLNYLLFSSAQEYVKLNHLEDVFLIYYETFVSITGEIEGFSLGTIRKEFIERLGLGLFVGLMFRPGTLSDEPFDFEAFFEERESEINCKMYRNPKFISETVKLLPLFKKHGVFK